MNGRRMALVAVLAVVLVPALTGCVAYGDEFQTISIDAGKVVFGDDFALEEGETLDGGLVVFGGAVELEEDSLVEGDVVVFGGSVEVAGTVDGELAVIGGNIELLDTAVVEGDLVTVGGDIDREAGAQVRGQEIAAPQELPWGPPVIVPFFPDIGRAISYAPASLALRVLLGALRLLLTAAVMAGLAGLVAVLWPQPAARVGRTCIQDPLPAFGVGLGAVVVVALLLISLCLTIVGILGGLAAGVAAVFGWLALGILIGERVLAALTPRDISPFWSAALGAGLLTLLGSLLDLIPCVGWIGWFLVMCVGLGAVVLTRFGTMEYPMSAAALPVEVEEAEE